MKNKEQDINSNEVPQIYPQDPPKKINEQIEKDRMTSEGGISDSMVKSKMPAKVYLERRYNEVTPREFLARILIREAYYEKFHW